MSIHAPYNFVPLSAWIYKPDWGHLVSHDLPFSDGISGTLNIESKAHTPLLVGRRPTKATTDEARHVWFYQDSSGRYAIPGSSLKGMIRNVLEIAAFGKMRAVDDRTLSVRDLTDGAKTIYREKFTDTLEDKAYRPRAEAGWLKIVRMDNGLIEWQLTSCEYARVEQNDLIRYGEKKLQIDNLENLKLKKKCSRAVEKYRLWGEHRLVLRFDLDSKTRWPHREGDITLVYDKAKPDLGIGSKEGTLVFTGRPADNNGDGGRKHMEFIFYSPVSEAVNLDGDLVRDFVQVHGESDSKDTQKVWHYWNRKLRLGDSIPVFYLENDNKIESLGLAMMYRLPYARSIHETIAHTNPGHINDCRDDFLPFDTEKPISKDNRLYDLPELLFGTVHRVATDHSMRSRVSFSSALLQGDSKLDKEVSSKKVVLSNPKPSYYPSYIHQPDAVGSKLNKGNNYLSYMDTNAEVRGWKRYPTRRMPQTFKVRKAGGKHESASELTKTVLHPLARDVRFSAVITVHNLRPVELGALVWALTWGDKPEFCHSLGMGKPFGLGQVSVHVTAAALDNINSNKATKPDIEACLFDFTEHMKTVWKQATNKPGAKWHESEQLRQLLAMANPLNAPGGCRELQYMSIDPNEFQSAKGRKQGDPHYVLEPYTPYKGYSEQTLFKRPSENERLLRAAKLELEKQMEKLSTEKEKALYEKMHSDLFYDSKRKRAVAENRANDWCDKQLHRTDGTLKRLIAERLKAFYEELDKWSGDGLKINQRRRVQKIKEILGEE